ncbi:hypothetical protein MKP08_13765 [Erythrobacter sp. LQ02-29]|uniref:hypothetical protein n=1 Tax=Erythrobacter sp. LQ02-29 TaxID=2920384 RepID=UPI001F4ED7E6|nr:hypothetical protein [Erythrobacter sp. LQ02-29]MCP9223810.1 hypothetical protein [Erythrobacter sp. LQ02-29]
MMEVIVYFEGADSTRDWVSKLLNRSDITFRKIPSQNSSSSFSELPSYISDILYLDKPDIIIAGSNDGIHEKPIFSIELAACTPQFQHALQRFPRLLASVASGCPTVLIMPLRKRSNDGKSTYQRSVAADYGAVRLTDIFHVPALVIDWPDDDGILLYEGSDGLPPLNSKSIADLGSYLRDCLTSFAQVDYLGALARLPQTQFLTDQTRMNAYKNGNITIARPGGGGTNAQVKLDLCATSDVIHRLTTEGRATATSISQLPDYFRAREQSLLFYPTRISDHAGDPYVGMMTYYDIAFCRTGPSTRDRRFNLIAYAQGVELSETTERMKKFNDNTCLFSKGYKPSNARHYSYYLRDGCRKLKSKPIRIYGEIADLIAYEDAILMNA